MTTIILLKWSKEREPQEFCRYNHAVAASPIGEFSVQWKGWKEHDSRALFFCDDFIQSFDSLDEAKAAAQKLFEEKVRACLKVTK